MIPNFDQITSVLPWWVLPLVALFAILVGVVGAHQEAGAREERRAAVLTARDAWMADCTKPVDECAAAWDDGYTLRQIYLERQ